jgi:hypothetical protein
MWWDLAPIILAVVAILLSYCEQPRAAAIAGYLSLFATQLGRLRALRRAERADRELVTTARE